MPIIKYKTRKVYGNKEFLDIIDPLHQQAYENLTGRKTLTPKTIHNLITLGCTFEEIKE